MSSSKDDSLKELARSLAEIKNAFEEMKRELVQPVETELRKTLLELLYSFEKGEEMDPELAREARRILEALKKKSKK